MSTPVSYLCPQTSVFQRLWCIGNQDILKNLDLSLSPQKVIGFNTAIFGKLGFSRLVLRTFIMTFHVIYSWDMTLSNIYDKSTKVLEIDEASRKRAILNPLNCSKKHELNESYCKSG